MSAGLVIFIIIVAVILLIVLFMSFKTSPSLPGNIAGNLPENPNLDPNLNPNLNPNVPAGGNKPQFMGHKPQNFQHYSQMKARFTDMSLIPNSGASNDGFMTKSGVYTISDDGTMTVWGRVKFDNDVPLTIKNDKLLPQLGLISNGKLLNSISLPVKQSGNGRYMIPAGKYDVDYTGDLSKGDNLTFEVAGPPQDLKNIMNSALGNDDTSFGGIRINQ